MRRRETIERPDIPVWVADLREWSGAPGAPLPLRHRLWGEQRWQWLDRYGYDVFNLNDAEVAQRRWSTS